MCGLGKSLFACSFSIGTFCACIPSKDPFHFVIPPPQATLFLKKNAFTLVEMVVVMVILVILMTAGVSFLNGTGSQSRRAGTDLLSGLIEQARTMAVTSRSTVVLAIAEPGDPPSTDERCRIGLFKIAKDWPSPATPPLSLDGVLATRWQTLNTGIVLIGGNVDGVANPLDQAQIEISYTAGGKTVKGQFHVLAFNSRGGLIYPAGSTPVGIRVAEGGYRGTPPVATANLRAGQKSPTENQLKIGRVIARSYRIDP